MTFSLKYLIIVALLSLVYAHQLAANDEDIWLSINTETLRLTIMQGDSPIEVYKNIAIGRNGAHRGKIKGDDTTPIGNFRIGWINPGSRYHLFFGLNYPSIDDAKQALKAGTISTRTYRSLITADIFGKTPPQNTELGGQIGIHGLGRADPGIHAAVNWTHGCIALTNRQIDRLSRWIKKGTVVKIH